MILRDRWSYYHVAQPCDPDQTVVEAWKGRVEKWEGKFNKVLRPDEVVVDPAAYTGLSELATRLRGDGKARTPGMWIDVSREFYDEVVSRSDHELYEAIYYVLTEGAPPYKAAGDAICSRYGRFRNGAGADAPDEVMEMASHGLAHIVDYKLTREGWTTEDLPLVVGIWRGQLLQRLLGFSRYEGLTKALVSAERDDLLLSGDSGWRRSPVSETNSLHALSVLEAMGSESHFKSYAEIERLTGLGKGGAAAVTGAKRALQSLGIQPSLPEFKAQLQEVEGYLKAASSHSADGNG